MEQYKIFKLSYKPVAYGISSYTGMKVASHIEHKRNRGGVSRLVAGPSACSYLKLYNGYSATGKQAQRGAHQEGTLDQMPLFKVPSTIIPTDEVLTIKESRLSQKAA